MFSSCMRGFGPGTLAFFPQSKTFFICYLVILLSVNVCVWVAWPCDGLVNRPGWTPPSHSTSWVTLNRCNPEQVRAVMTDLFICLWEMESQKIPFWTFKIPMYSKKTEPHFSCIWIFLIPSISVLILRSKKIRGMSFIFSATRMRSSDLAEGGFTCIQLGFEREKKDSPKLWQKELQLINILVVDWSIDNRITRGFITIYFAAFIWAMGLTIYFLKRNWKLVFVYFYMQRGSLM